MHLNPDSVLTYQVGMIVSIWFVLVGITIGWVMQLVFPVRDELDHLRRRLFTIFVLAGSFIGRLVETYVLYGTIFREGWWILIWSLCIMLGVSYASREDRRD